MFELEGSSLHALFLWASWEMALPLEWTEPSLEEEAMSIIAHGDVDGLTPMEALQVALPGSGLEALESNGALRVVREGASGPSDLAGELR